MTQARDSSRDRITDLITLWRQGDKAAGDRLFALLYEELRPLARTRIRRNRSDRALDTSAVIHETYLKLTSGSRLSVQSRAHLLALASRVMRQIVLDHARRETARKRGGDLVRVSTFVEAAPSGTRVDDILALEEALEKLGLLDARLAQMVTMRFFGGLTIEETARALGVSPATIKRDWLRARTFLFQQLTEDREP